MVIFAMIVSACFALLMKSTDPERWRYFLRLLFYFIGLGFIAAWVMNFFPFR